LELIAGRLFSRLRLVSTLITSHTQSLGHPH
jgi:hypothetical protein